MSSESIHVTPVGGNVFADLGFEPDQAEKLLAESKAIISKKLAAKNLLLLDSSQSPAARELANCPIPRL